MRYRATSESENRFGITPTPPQPLLFQARLRSGSYLDSKSEARLIDHLTYHESSASITVISLMNTKPNQYFCPSLSGPCQYRKRFGVPSGQPAWGGGCDRIIETTWRAAQAAHFRP